ncbi:hypothetical protein BV20DRAFT_1111051 [Pilatotrama ljubarskyi]|nr:hypothetical protein BV20DRAFT_1111051 [Pilatotrama ljubarskyi]
MIPSENLRWAECQVARAAAPPAPAPAPPAAPAPSAPEPAPPASGQVLAPKFAWESEDGKITIHRGVAGQPVGRSDPRLHTGVYDLVSASFSWDGGPSATRFSALDRSQRATLRRGCPALFELLPVACGEYGQPPDVGFSLWEVPPVPRFAHRPPVREEEEEEETQEEAVVGQPEHSRSASGCGEDRGPEGVTFERGTPRPRADSCVRERPNKRPVSVKSSASHQTKAQSSRSGTPASVSAPTFMTQHQDEDEDKDEEQPASADLSRRAVFNTSLLPRQGNQMDAFLACIETGISKTVRDTAMVRGGLRVALDWSSPRPRARSNRGPQSVFRMRTGTLAHHGPKGFLITWDEPDELGLAQAITELAFSRETDASPESNPFAVLSCLYEWWHKGNARAARGREREYIRVLLVFKKRQAGYGMPDAKLSTDERWKLGVGLSEAHVEELYHRRKAVAVYV